MIEPVSFKARADSQDVKTSVDLNAREAVIQLEEFTEDFTVSFEAVEGVFAIDVDTRALVLNTQSTLFGTFNVELKEVKSEIDEPETPDIQIIN